MPPPPLPEWASRLTPSFEAFLDAVCVTDATGAILHANPAMRVLLGLQTKQLSRTPPPKLTDFLTLPSVPGNNPFAPALFEKGALRYDEAPATKVDGGERIRILLLITQIREPITQEVQGHFVNVRETTAEILLQAKYLKLQQILEKKEAELQELRSRTGSST
jgi:PAS domain-containing protein